MKKNKTEQAPVTPEQEATVAEEAAETEVVEEATIEQWQEALGAAVAERDKAMAECAQRKDSFLRTQADFQNFKRRNQTTRTDGYNDGLCDCITELLPVIDNLERALAAAEENDPLAEGVKMTLKMLTDGLAKYGFAEVPALGEEFDPEKHNAVMRETGDEPGKILEVFQKGYKVKDKIIRYAMVKVAAE
ncbi:MAG: nucleotide exchange factor GrpE [Clostridia bacterium]|nr:nucleotide exchange factor GrpE [Clostridia bacterium]